MSNLITFLDQRLLEQSYKQKYIPDFLELISIYKNNQKIDENFVNGVIKNLINLENSEAFYFQIFMRTLTEVTKVL